MKPRLHRRAFIRAVIGVAAAATLPACSPPNISGTGDTPLGGNVNNGTANDAADQDPISVLLRKKFNYLQLEAVGVAKFTHDFRERAGAKLLQQQETDPEQFEYAVSSQYLMSTDFFRNGADESRPLKYTGYYDLYNGCTSPFARFD